MSAGTKYDNKNDLIDAVVALVYANVGNKVSATSTQTAFCDLIESLWGGSSAITVIPDYSDLINLLGSETLEAGSIYQFEYQCIHEIPHTSVLNINSPNYVTITETFYAEALSNTTLSPIVVSKDFPKDMIIMDFLDATAEDGVTARTGKVLYRKGHDTRNETAYDFRGVYFRRYAIDYSHADIDSGFTIGSAATKGDLVIYGNRLQKASNDIVSFDGNSRGYLYNIDHYSNNGSTAVYWLPYDQFNLGNAVLPADLTDFQDSLTFTGNSVGNSIGLTSDNNGYNGVTLYNASNISIANNSKDTYIEESANTYQPIMLENCLYGQNHNNTASELIGCLLWDCDGSLLKDVSQSLIWWSNDLELGPNAIDLNFYYTRNTEFGPNAFAISTNYVDNVDIGPECQETILINVQTTTIGSAFGQSGTNTNVLMGMKSCSVGDNCGGFNILSSGNSYDSYEYLTIGNDVTNLLSEIAANFKHTTISDGASEIIVHQGGSIEYSRILNGASNIEVNNGSTIAYTTIEEGFRGLYIENGGEIIYSTLRAYDQDDNPNTANFANLYMGSGGKIATSDIFLHSLYPSYDNNPSNTNLFVSNGSQLNGVRGWFLFLYLTNSTTLLNSTFGMDSFINSGTGTLSIQQVVAGASTSIGLSGNAGSVVYVTMGGGASITLTEGDIITTSSLSESCSITLNGAGGIGMAPATISKCVFNPNWLGTLQSNYTEQVFTKSTGNGSTWDYQNTNTVGGGYGTNSSNTSVSLLQPILTNADPEYLNSLGFSVNQAVTIDKTFIPHNRKYKFLLRNATGGAAASLVVTLFDSGLTADLTADGAQEYIEFIRLYDSTHGINKVVILSQTSV